MNKIADLQAEEHHISVGEAFIRNQQRIISERTQLGLSTEMDEHWLSVFTDGVARHRKRLSEILEDMTGGSDTPIIITGECKPEHRGVGIGYLGVSCQRYVASSHDRSPQNAPAP